MLGITRKDFLSYSLLPGVTPRLKDLFMSGFQHIPFFMALVYHAVRLLPANHPYLKPENVGKFGTRHIVAAAANNLVVSWKNIDQVALFVTLLLGIVVFFVEIILLAISFMAGPVLAAMPVNFAGFFLTPAATRPQDLAHMMFDLIFGIPNPPAGVPLFGSCFNPAVGVACLDPSANPIADGAGVQILSGMGWPLPIHEGLHAMFLMYNTGLLVVAFLIMSYFIVAILIETAESGTAFGKRFNRVWAPLRIVMAFGLLVPFGLGAGGLNSAQYIVLYAAKFGSGFATNGWNIFNTTLVGSYTGQVIDLVSKPNSPEISGLLQFMYTASVCWEIENARNDRQPVPYAVKDNVSAPNFLLIQPNTTYQQLMDFSGGERQVMIRFGIQDAVLYGSQRGNVSPICGELVLPLTDGRNPTAVPPPERSAVIMQAYYFAIVKELWYETFFNYQGCPGCQPPELAPWVGPAFNYANSTMKRYTPWDQDSAALLPVPEYKAAVQAAYAADILAVLTGPGARGIAAMDPAIGGMGAIQATVISPKWSVGAPLLEKGWAGAGLWYNRIAELNGGLSTAVLNIPVVTRYPEIMEHVSAKKAQQNQDISMAERFKPELADGRDVPIEKPQDLPAAVALWEAFHFWDTDGGAATSHTATTGNAIIDFVNGLLGTSGLYSIRKNPNIHPLAQLTGVGRSLIEAATRNLKLSLGAGIAGAVVGGAGGAAMSGVVSLLMTIVIAALSIGFVLYYVLPFLPFLYFFFAVGGWFKAIFQAMVGAPLWALAHIRIDGPGLAGQAAVTGYFMILEIFLRPILIIFGLLASISIFGALVTVLNQTWDLVTTNLSGFDLESEIASPSAAIGFFRGPLDEFFFTVVYTIVVYMMALTSFKLVDIIPNNILRWMGQSVQPFNDAKEDAGQSLSSTAAVGGNQALQSMGGEVSKALKTVATRGGG